MTTAKVSAKELVGQMATIHVYQEPCRVRYGDCSVLTETVNGRLLNFKMMPAGAIGFIEVDGYIIAFDADLDIKSGKIEIQLVHQ